MEAKDKNEVRQIVQKEFRRFGCQYDRLRIEKAPNNVRQELPENV